MRSPRALLRRARSVLIVGNGTARGARSWNICRVALRALRLAHRSLRILGSSIMSRSICRLVDYRMFGGALTNHLTFVGVGQSTGRYPGSASFR